MKKNYTQPIFLIILSTIFFYACTSGDKGANPATGDSTTIEQTIIEQPDTVLFWTIDDYKKTKTAVYKDTIEITEPESVVNGVNSIYPNIHLKFDRLSNDTVYAKIDSSFTFSNDMGTAGAAEYLSTVVLNLTTLKNVNFVNLDFPQGSHASPGVFAKTNYASYKIKDSLP